MGEERGGGEEAFVERKSGGGEVSSFNGGARHRWLLLEESCKLCF